MEHHGSKAPECVGEPLIKQDSVSACRKLLRPREIVHKTLITEKSFHPDCDQQLIRSVRACVVLPDLRIDRYAIRTIFPNVGMSVNVSANLKKNVSFILKDNNTAVLKNVAKQHFFLLGKTDIPINVLLQ